MFILSDKAYNSAKHMVQVILPAVGALYFSLSDIWDLPHALQVVGTIACFTTFLGVCLGISHNTYAKTEAAFGGKIVISDTDDGKTLYSLELDTDPEMIQLKDTVSFKVIKT